MINQIFQMAKSFHFNGFISLLRRDSGKTQWPLDQCLSPLTAIRVTGRGGGGGGGGAGGEGRAHAHTAPPDGPGT